ncbi:hypothetical protein GCM10014715_28460 [Streptomyces spiralis]|uniref:Uncharacterized protein n=1 Tax=Streptomyces spiralis TaxID=66376 RepID=A0A919DRK1_9ACTN|nr:hypothetical protein GCM10014715_28460 [Streptomyces spiralis]
MVWSADLGPSAYVSAEAGAEGFAGRTCVAAASNGTEWSRGHGQDARSDPHGRVVLRCPASDLCVPPTRRPGPADAVAPRPVLRRQMRAGTVGAGGHPLPVVLRRQRRVPPWRSSAGVGGGVEIGVGVGAEGEALGEGVPGLVLEPGGR